MPTIQDLIRDSAIGKAMFGSRYGDRDPYVEAIKAAESLGYPVPGDARDVGEAQRYMASKLAAERYGPLPLLTNPIHEAALSWFAEGEGRPSLDRLLAGYRGTFDALEASPKTAEPVREGLGLEGAEIKPENSNGNTIQAILASVLSRR